MRTILRLKLATLFIVIQLVTSYGVSAAAVSVNIAGSLQSELGCLSDWDPACPQTGLAYDAGDDVWQATFAIPAGSYEYKAALNGAWTDSYGQHGIPGGANITLSLPASTAVKFYYDDKTHWVTDSVNSRIVVAPGSFQSELGCPGDWAPDCLRSWLEDLDGDGVYTFMTNSIPAGAFEFKVAISEDWTENYGAGGVPGGANISFTIPSGGATVLFRFFSSNNLPEVIVIQNPLYLPQIAR
jgi:hypothetical protein